MPKSGFGGIPKGWCTREPDSKGLSSKKAHKDSFVNVFYTKFPKVKSKTGAKGATVGMTYGCPKGEWDKKGKIKKSKKKGKCKGGMRIVRIMKPKSRVSTSKNKRKYKCRKGK